MTKAAWNPKTWLANAARWLGLSDASTESAPVPSELEAVPEVVRFAQPEAEPKMAAVPEPSRSEPSRLACLHGDHCLSLGSNAAFRIYADGCVECVPCADQHTEGHRR